ncbi:ferritin-like catalase Nec2 [Arachis stenosperma]|uniref:ferritin-like catalase Nec2 n=1 Tax=Arachis stenosperma TaxID=217475 RepID=UPI0025AD2D81|nr:ferritin-like catalase Nec2 [Arachis stenosperma]
MVTNNANKDKAAGRHRRGLLKRRGLLERSEGRESGRQEVPVKSFRTIPKSDADLIEFALNLEYLEAEFFLYGALGYGLDKFAPKLTQGGPSPFGGKIAYLSPLIKDVTLQFALQEVGHLRAIKNTVKGFPRPLLNLSSETFGQIIDSAFGKKLYPSFDPYANDINYLIASYAIPYVGLNGYVGANPLLKSPLAKGLIAGLLGVESGQDAVIRALLYERKDEIVKPYKWNVAEFTNHISQLRNTLGKGGIKDEGLVVPKELGAEGNVTGNILAGNIFSYSYARSPQEILRIVYGTSNERTPGGFYPQGGRGTIAKSFL